MKSRTRSALILCGLSLAFSAAAWAADPFVGTWKMDPAQSKSTLKSEIYTVAPEGSDGVRLTKDYVGAQGVSHHHTGICKFDGKDYPVPGHLLPDATRAVKRIDAHTWEVTLKSGGKVVSKSREVVSNDGNTLTATGTTSAAFSTTGKTLDYTTVYTRQ